MKSLVVAIDAQSGAAAGG